MASGQSKNRSYKKIWHSGQCHLAEDCEIEVGSDDDPMQLPGPKGFSILVL